MRNLRTPTWLQYIRRKADEYRTAAPIVADSSTGLIQRFDPGVAAQLRLPAHNVFRHLAELQIPNVAYVAGAGPLLLKELEQIPRDAYVIACNRAIQAGFPFRLWMVFDLNCHQFTWFKTPPLGGYKKVFGYKLGRTQPGSFIFSSRHTDYVRRVAAGGLQGGGTIVCCALQLLFWAGCRTAIMLGCPLSGNTHFDGTPTGTRNEVWKQAHQARSYIQQMESGGMTILALNHNALDVPLVKEVQHATAP